MNKTGERLAGVLMPVSALPSREGIGTFGKESYHFVDVLSKMGMSIWQILPLNPLGYGNSPYQPFSSYAGDELYVDLELLAEKGYLKKSAAPLESQGRVDYDAARKFKEPYLREAFAEFRKTVSLDAGYASFCKLDWVKPYAVFISLKRANDMRCWNEWPKEQQNWILDGKYDLSELADEIAYQMFLQYMFYVQWNELKAYANGKGILIMGDIPFYVGIDSLDVWKAREDFLLDQDGRPRFIAGVPPDYFSATGQRWGNPIYDWEHLEQNHFQFWIDRLAYSTKLYDILRIDHFRAFDTYWRIPASCPTAVSGEWLEAPGYKLFDTIYEQLPDAWIVAEDLGELRPEVLVLRDHYGLMGMFIAEFSLLYEEAHKNRLIYTGTHDNQTVKGWYVDMDRQMRAQVDAKLKPYGKPGDSVVNRMLHYVLESEADMAVIPAMDVLELDDSARLNTPGTVGSPNWEWRMESLEAMEERIEWMREMVLESKRGRKE
ncbi:MAG: 4-alpha-glucanotransferase [Lachnospiraceae bacterium]|nr:4-alpha-glucanotransferase [Lachnospiraceae bacterium]